MISFKHYYKSEELTGSGEYVFRRISAESLDVEPEVDSRFIQYVEGQLAEILPEDFGNVIEIPSYTLMDVADLDNKNYVDISVELPDTVTTVGERCFQSYRLKKLIFSPNISTINDKVVYNSAAENCVIDFSKAKNIPTRIGYLLDGDSSNTVYYDSFTASNISSIQVPTSLYSKWIARDDWKDISSKIVAV